MTKGMAGSLLLFIEGVVEVEVKTKIIKKRV